MRPNWARFHTNSPDTRATTIENQLLEEEEVTDTKPAEAPAVPQKWVQFHGRHLRKMAHAGLIWLEQNRQHVNSLNVFPVPDGDTGTNMLLTMRAAYRRIQDMDDTHLGKVADTLARGALMGARGNSGVILSQIWRGLARGLRDKETADAKTLAAAIQEASDTAYSGVMRPVEGTILTVIREGAAEAVDAAAKSQDLRFLLERVRERCQQALDRTPEQLPILKQAGVVDSGGQGLVYIFDGMLHYVNGNLGDLTHYSDDGTLLLDNAAADHDSPAQAHAIPEGGSLEFPYDVQFILMGNNLNVTEVRNRIDAMGDSTVVVGDETTIKVHIHVKDPGEPLSYGISLGQVTDVVVENMQEQMEEIVHSANGTAVAQPPILEDLTYTIEPGQIGVVAIAAGDGLAAIFQSLGVAHIVPGGQTNNPSTEEIFQAIQDVPSDKVIILPNNKNIILASESARDISPKQVVVVPTVTAPQGLSAMLGWNPDGDLAETAASMQDLAQSVVTAELTRATRSVEIDGVTVAEGEMIGLVNGKLCTANDSLNLVLAGVLDNMDMDEREIVSVYYGADKTEADATAVAEFIEDRHPDVEVEVHAGGQPHYYFIIGVE